MEPHEMSIKMLNNSGNHLACIGLMNPMYINVKNNGAKRLTMSK